MLNVGIIGLGQIATRVAKGIKFAKNANLYAVASRDINKAITFKQAHDAQKAYDDYSKLCADQNVDVVYICTPNTLHKEHIMLALSHHKHVICEKPIFTKLEDLDACFQYAKKQGCLLMEAHKTVFTPLNQHLFNLISKGIIGKVHFIEGQYASEVLPSQKAISKWHFEAEGGGCLYDIGVYPLAFANYFAHSKIKEYQLMEHKVDGIYCDQAQAMITYENGIMAHIATSWQCDMVNMGYIYGEKGHIEYHNFWKNTQAYLVKDGQKTLIEVDMDSDFTGEIEHAIACIEQGLCQSNIMSQEASKEILKVITKKV
ncbi:MAG: Gfo/Idh/MocA family oxidoreductase [Erysipelotrichaceae bacterium]|nr:Gfo/Idh/MocA family oxidoreductase [Erysipelotrichaceae bacterium]MDY5252594.1 Gfo/Idh/MocA family oxidoreductase [Erysipelotrichaceae bacterium]